MMLRRISATGFATAILAFGLPFATVSCSGEAVSFTGFELAFDQVPSDGGELAGDVEDEASLPALVALLAGVWGLVATLLGRGRPVLAAWNGVLALTYAGLNTGPADVAFHAGYVLALSTFAGLALGHSAEVSVRRLKRRRRARRRLAYG